VAPAKKGGKKAAQSATNKVATRKYTTNLHRSSHGVAFEKCAPQLQMCALTPGSTKLLGQRNKESPILCAVVRKHNEDSPHKLCMLATYVSVTIIKNLRMVTMDEN
ncbi:hypothetical protein FD754_010934, partial [Muntiacus muntjak]